MKQKTLKKSFSIAGIGLHSGLSSNICILPAPADTGVIFRRTDLNPAVDIAVKYSNIRETLMCTLLVAEDGKTTVSTIEHLMSALAMFKIDNVIIEVDCPELPVMDGSSFEFVKIIESIGTQDLSIDKQVIKITKPIRVEFEDKFAEVYPSDNLKYEFKIKFEHSIISSTNDRIVFDADLDDYKSDVSKARTFGFYDKILELHKNNLAKGASLDNAVGISNKGILNKEGLRYDDEFVRHKLLDAIGDFYVGGEILGHFNCYKSGHTLNNRLLHAIYSTPKSWEYI